MKRKSLENIFNHFFINVTSALLGLKDCETYEVSCRQSIVFTEHSKKVFTSFKRDVYSKIIMLTGNIKSETVNR